MTFGSESRGRSDRPGSLTLAQKLNAGQRDDPLAVEAALQSSEAHARALLSDHSVLGLRVGAGRRADLSFSIEAGDQAGGSGTAETLATLLLEPSIAVYAQDHVDSPPYDVNVRGICSLGFTSWTLAPLTLTPLAGWSLRRVNERFVELHGPDGDSDLFARALLDATPEWLSAVDRQRVVLVIYGSGVGVRPPEGIPPGRYSDDVRRGELDISRAGELVAAGIVHWAG